MNGYNEIIAEPCDDEDLALAYGFEVINAEELYDMLSMSFRAPQPSSSSAKRRGNGKQPSTTSSGSFVSARSSGISSLMTKPMSSCSLSSQGSEFSDDAYSSAESGGMPESALRMVVEDPEEEDYQKSVDRFWYMIQQKRHHHQFDEEKMKLRHPFLDHPHHHHNRVTEWFDNLIHFPQKLRQIAADKQRFNINKIPQQVRDELKHIYVY